MKKYTLISLILVFSISTIFAQTDYDDDYLYMKCGTKFGKRSELVDACVGNIPKDVEDAYTEKYELCTCLMETIAKHFTYKEFETLVTMYDENWTKYVLLEGDPIVISELEDCTMTYVNEDFDWTKNEERFEEGFIISCVRELENDPNLKDIDIDIFAYCNCIKEEFLQRGFSISMLGELEDENSILFNEVLMSCLNEPGIFEENSNSENDVTGYYNNIFVPVINIGGIFKVKISVGNLSKYFTIDSGASDMMVSTDFERDLILEGLVNRDDYLSDYNYTLADGSIIKCRRILLNSIQIGEFIVNNVIVAVIDNSDISLLLGKSFLDKFNNWSIDNKKSTLYLERKSF